jgi:hypothetical protein
MAGKQARPGRQIVHGRRAEEVGRAAQRYLHGQGRQSKEGQGRKAW